TVKNDQELEHKEKALKDLQLQLAESQLRLAQEVQLRYQQLVEKDQQLAEKDQQLAEKDQQLRAKARSRDGIPSGFLQEQKAQDSIHRNLVIGVVTYNNSPHQIEKLLTSARLAARNAADLGIRSEIFVVDNGAASFWKEGGIP